MSFWKTIAGLTDSTNARNIRADPITNGICTIDVEHYQGHLSNGYVIRGWSDISSATTDFLAVVPNTALWPHVRVSLSAEGEFTIQLYEGATTSSDGTPLSSMNKNRNSLNTAGMVLYATPTILTTGTLLPWSSVIGSGKSVGGEIGSEEELILKQNTKYLIRISKVGVGTLWLAWQVVWYEYQNLP